MVFLAQLHALFPAVVALVEVGCDAPELDQFVLLQALSQRYVIKVVVGINGSSQTLLGRQLLHHLPYGSRGEAEKYLSMVQQA